MARIHATAKKEIGQNRLRKALLDAVPNNWLDPLLTGPKAVIGQPPYNCKDIERLLNAVRARVSSTVSDGR